jgi:hypothetical protein
MVVRLEFGLARSCCILWPDSVQRNVQETYGSWYGKPMPIPPAGCVFLRGARVGCCSTQGQGNARGLLSADKYGQDPFHDRLPALRGLLATETRSQGLGLDSLERWPEAAIVHIREIGAGAFGKVRPCLI